MKKIHLFLLTAMVTMTANAQYFHVEREDGTPVQNGDVVTFTATESSIEMPNGKTFDMVICEPSEPFIVNDSDEELEITGVMSCDPDASISWCGLDGECLFQENGKAMKTGYLAEENLPMEVHPSFTHGNYTTLSAQITLYCKGQTFTYTQKFVYLPAFTGDALADGEAYNSTTSQHANFTYTRDFSHTGFQSLYVPFAMNYSDWSGDLKVYRLNNVNQYDDDEDGVYDRTVLEVLQLTEGSSTEAHTPYIVKPLNAGSVELALTNVTLEAAESRDYTVSSWNELYTFTGTYSTETDLYDKGAYAFNEGSLCKASSSDVTLMPQRWYMTVKSRNAGSAVVSAPRMEISVIGEETTTGIRLYPTNDARRNPQVFDLQGRRTNDTGRGIRIVDGKKILK